MVTISSFTEEDAKVPYGEYFKDIPTDEKFDLKSCPYEDKVRFVKYIMGDPGLINTNLLSNIVLLISASELSDDVFEDKDCIFNSLMEYVDIKTDLLLEIRDYSGQLLMYFLSAIKSYNTVLQDNKVDIPAAYCSILLIMKIGDISKLMNRVATDTEKLALVNGSEDIVNHFFISSNVVDDFVKFITG